MHQRQGFILIFSSVQCLHMFVFPGEAYHLNNCVNNCATMLTNFKSEFLEARRHLKGNSETHCYLNIPIENTSHEIVINILFKLVFSDIHWYSHWELDLFLELPHTFEVHNTHSQWLQHSFQLSHAQELILGFWFRHSTKHQSRNPAIYSFFF